MTRFKNPKFKKGDEVNTPDGDGKIERISWMQGQHWYWIVGYVGSYAEGELKLIKKGA